MHYLMRWLIYVIPLKKKKTLSPLETNWFFSAIPVFNANCVDPEQKPVSDLGLH